MVQLPGYIILKILLYNTNDLIIYRRIFTSKVNKIVKTGIQNILNTELFKWQYLFTFTQNINIVDNTFYSNNIDVINLGIKMGSYRYSILLKHNNIEFVKLAIKLVGTLFYHVIDTFHLDSGKSWELYNIIEYNQCLLSDNLDVVKHGIRLGAKYFNNCLYSNNLDVVKHGVSLGANYFNNCLMSKNIEVIKYGLDHNANDYNSLLLCDNLAMVKFAVKKGARAYNNCLKSSNLNVVKYGIRLGAKHFNKCLLSNNLEVVKYGIKLGANNYSELLKSNNVDVLLYYYIHYSKK